MAWMRQKSETPPEPARPQTMEQSTRPMAQTRPAEPAPVPKKEPQMEQKKANVGQSVKVTGELTSREDLTVEGQVDGSISLPDNHLTIGANGRIKAQIMAKTVMILGQVKGDIMAKEKVDIAPSGSVEGDITAPRVAIADGARFRGSIDMESATASQSKSTQNQQNQNASQNKNEESKVAMAAS